MIEEEIAELNRIKEWAVILKIYYGILIRFCCKVLNKE